MRSPKDCVLLFFIASILLAESQAQNRDLIGDYRTEDGDNISILQAELGFAFFHFGTGRFGVLHRDTLNPLTWYAGPGAIGTSPREINIQFHNESPISLVYQDLRKGTVQFAIKDPPYRKRDFELKRADVRIKATLSLPQGKGPFPGIVLVHGGGPGPRSALEVWSNMYNRFGIACLTYDKRGSGETVGPEWRTFKDLADDASACVDFMGTRPEISNSQIGMAAFSQGGWVSEIAASRNKNISFLIMISCPVESDSERDRESALLRLRVDGFSDEDIAEARTFGETFDAYGHGKISWPAYKKLLDESKKQEWFSYVEFTSAPVDSNSFYTSPYGRYYNPSSDLSSLQIPVLALYGYNDTTVPPKTNSTKALSYLRNSHPLTMVLVLPTANHGLVESKTGSDRELVDLNTYVSGYFGLLHMWLNSVLTQ